MLSFTSSSEPPSGRSLLAWLRDLAAFLLVLAAILAGLEAFARTRYLLPEVKLFAALAAGPAPSTLVLGASTALFAIEPRLLDRPGLPAFSAAIYGAGPRYWRAWYELVARPRFRPQVVLIDLPAFWDNTWLWRRIEHDAMHLPVDAYFAMLWRQDADRAMALGNSLVLNMRRREIVPLLLGRIFRDVPLAPLPPPAPPPAAPPPPLPPAPGPSLGAAPTYPVDPTAGTELKALLDDLAADGVRVVILQSPSYRPAATANAALQALARRRGLAFLDYNGARCGPINQDRGAFSDAVHMRPASAKRFTARLVADLTAEDLWP